MPKVQHNNYRLQLCRVFTSENELEVGGEAVIYVSAAVAKQNTCPRCGVVRRNTVVIQTRPLHQS